MPGWWYTIESNTTNHAITQFEHACREALSSDRATRELMRAKSAKQRFPVAEWIKKLDKLQSTAIKTSQGSRKRSAFPSRRFADGTESRQFFGVPRRTSRRGDAGLGIPPSLTVPTLPAGRRNSPQWSNFTRESSANSRRSDTSLNLPGEDATLLVPSPWTDNIIEPPRTGSILSRSLSLGSRLGPGHTRGDRQSTSTIELLDEHDEEQYYMNPDELEELENTARSGVGSEAEDDNERSSEESDDTASDADSVFESNLQRESVSYTHQLRRYPLYPYNSSGDAYPESGPAAQSNEDYEMVVTSRPITPNLNDFASSQLSLASVTAGRDDFALSNVEDHFTDADGKYFKRFSSELCDLDSKTSKDDLCIREYIVRSEKQWADDTRNKKLGFHSLCHHRRPSTQASDDRPMSVSPPESLSEEPLLRYKPPKGMRRFLQRRIGDWPFYSLLLALVSFLQNVVNGRARS
jgi:alpha-1,3-glucan synthase